MDFSEIFPLLSEVPKTYRKSFPDVPFNWKSLNHVHGGQMTGFAYYRHRSPSEWVTNYFVNR